MTSAKELFDRHGVKQLGYYVESIEESAELMHEAMGVGPFLDSGVTHFDACDVRGEKVPLDIRTALGHMDDIQIELIEISTPGPDPYHEMGRFGLHHFCVYVDDVDVAVADLVDAGMSVAMLLQSGSGQNIAYVDARKELGQYIELCTPNDRLWETVKGLHDQADPAGPALIPISALMGK
ncbi:VOC family protein [Adlercreutzia sp. R25]|uniref:VOC family protein n=1 Tax=Adlercreutzia shanghongiae TaxID=3111773 RepID=A0ABU6J216_9ACTN|nr:MULTISPECIES: VOC family protein [unclassified Adlercreutzia]MEC4273774.1 VOC family protein [Adlercreutzia sp. R25]MEC4295852.1 VOC family protein [Adlercreutzia sp. R22]